MVKRSQFEPGKDPFSPNRNLAPLTTDLDEQGRLMVGGCLLSELANKYGTPLYVLDEKSLREACNAYRVALKESYQGLRLPLYASKAHSSLLLSRLISTEGFGIDGVSAG